MGRRKVLCVPPFKSCRRCAAFPIFFNQHESLNDMQDMRVTSEWDGFAGLIERLDQLHHRGALGGRGVKLSVLEAADKPAPGLTLLTPAGHGKPDYQDLALKKSLSALEAELQAYARRKVGPASAARRPVEGHSRRPSPNDPPASRTADLEFVKLALEFVKLAQAKEPGLKADIELLRGELTEVAARISQFSSTQNGERSPAGADALILQKVEAISERMEGSASSKSIDRVSERLFGVEAQLNEVAGAIAAIPPPPREELVRDLAAGLEALKLKLDAKIPTAPAGAQELAELKMALFDSLAKLQASQGEQFFRLEESTQKLPKAIALEILGEIEKTAKKYDSSARIEKKLNELAQELADAAKLSGRAEPGTRIAAEIEETISKLIARQEEETGHLRQSLGSIEAEIRNVVTKMTRIETGLLQLRPLPNSSNEVDSASPAAQPSKAEAMPCLFAGASLGLIEPGSGYPDDKAALPETESSPNRQSGSGERLADARFSLDEYGEGLSREDFIAAARKASQPAVYSGHSMVLCNVQDVVFDETEKLGSSLIQRLKGLMKRIKKPSGLTLLALLILGAAYNHLEDGRAASRLDQAQSGPEAQTASKPSRPVPGTEELITQTGGAAPGPASAALAPEVFDPPLLGTDLPVSAAFNSKQIAGSGKITAAALLPPGEMLVPVSHLESTAPGVSSEFLEIKRQAEAGDPVAQYETAQRFASGQGVQQDYGQAISFFERAAKLGLAPAQFRLASLYEKGLGTAKSPQIAAIWYERAAGNGNVHAMHNLGVLLAEGLEGRPDYSKAAFWFAQAAAYGEGDSQFNLAVLLGRGLGMPRDLGKSYAWFAIAAGRGDAEAAKKRDETGLKLSFGELQAAHDFAQSYLPRSRDLAANEAGIPSEGFKSFIPVVAKN